jgi:carbamoyltransferase
VDSPYMLLVAGVRDDRRLAQDGELDGVTDIGRRLKVPRSTVPAVTHVDYSARVQTVDPGRHGLYYRLIKRFKDKTDCPVVINTSFNIRGEPIVCTPEHAYRCFLATNMDVLVLEDVILYKEEQPEAQQHEIAEYISQFDLD